jgi:hypothetical protein
MKPTTEEIIQWLQNPTFATGIKILHKLNPHAKPNNTRTIAAKLCYHIKVPLSAEIQERCQKSDVRSRKPVGGEQKSEIRNQKSEIINQKSEILKSSNPNTPAFIEQIVREHARLVMLRSQLDVQRKAVPQTNTEANNKSRRVLTAGIHEHSNRIEALYEAKENYYTKAIMPDMKALGFEVGSQKSEVGSQKSVPTAPATKDQRPKTKDQQPKAKSQPQTPNPQYLTPNTQTDRLTSLRKLQTRDQNQLDFQSNTRKPEPNPMPDSPKRFAIIARMKKRLVEIEKVKSD